MKLISKPLVPLVSQSTLTSRVVLRLLNEIRLIYRKQLRQKLLKELTIFRNEDPSQSTIHMLVCKRDFEMAIISAMIINNLGNKGHYFIFHDDGSIDDEFETRFYEYLPGSKLIRRKIADKIMEEELSIYPALQEYRKKQVLALKLVDIPFFSQSKRIAYIDTDVLFFRYPEEYFQLLDNKTNLNIFNKDIASAYVTDEISIEGNLGIKLLPKINSGLWIMNKKDFSFSMIESWLEHRFLHSYLTDYRLEQTFIAMLASTSDAKTRYFPAGYDVSFEKDPEVSICKHYVGRIRYGYELEGLNYIIKNK